jgi:hypothetical protein
MQTHLEKEAGYAHATASPYTALSSSHELDLNSIVISETNIQPLGIVFLESCNIESIFIGCTLKFGVVGHQKQIRQAS